MSGQPTGCTGCGSRDTEIVDGVHGRRCGACRPAFSAKHLAGLAADRRDVGAYVRTVLAEEMPGLGGAA